MPSWPFAPGESPFRVKGVAYRTTLDVLSRRAGSFEVLLSSVPSGPARRFLEQPFLASSWYDVWPLAQLGPWVAPTLGATSAEVRKEVAREVARVDLNSVYRALMRLASTAFLSENLPRATANYFDFGATVVTERGERLTGVRRTGTPVEIADWYYIAASEWTCEALRLAGAQQPSATHRVVPEGRAHGVPTADVLLTFRWR